MTLSRKIGVAVLAVGLATTGMEFGASIGVPGVTSLVTETFARVGRPLTPVSVAGTARRSARRCAAGVTC